MSEITIRTASPADLADILKIERENPRAAHWREETYRGMWRDASLWRTFVAEQGAIVGFVVAHGVAGDWELQNIAVTPSVQRQGIARRLVQALVKSLELARAERVLLEVRESNTAARRLYESQGFVISGRRKGYYREPEEDALLFEKNFAVPSMKIR